MVRRRLHRTADRRTVHDEAGLAMIIVITVVMLMTFIPLAIFTQAMQQLPLARHDQDHESALAAAEAGVDDYLNRLEPEQQLLDVQRDEPAARRQPGVHGVGAGARAATTTARRSATRPTRRRPASTGTMYLTSSGQVAQRDPHGEGRDPPPGIPRLPLADRLRDHRPRALG